MTDYTPFAIAALVGLAGGLGYDYVYKLFAAPTYLIAIWHAAAGAIAALIIVYMGILPAPTDEATAIAIAGIGYVGTDFLDSLIQKIQSSAAGSTPPTAAAGPPAPPAP